MAESKKRKSSGSRSRARASEAEKANRRKQEETAKDPAAIEAAAVSPVSEPLEREDLPEGVEPSDRVAVSPLPGGVTMETPAEADKSSEPTPNDAKLVDPPVRSARPDVGIAQALGAGAGEHKVVVDPHLGSDGRWYLDEREAAAQRAGETFDPEKAGS